jgi:hypothetical protein
MTAKRFVFACIACFFACFTSAHAIVIAYKCNGCTESEYVDKARSIAAQNNLGTHLNPYAYIYDLAQGNLRKYAMSREQIPGGVEYLAEPIPLDPAESNLWTQAHEAIEANGGHSTFFLNIDATTSTGMPDRGTSAYDIVQTGAFQNDISDWLLYGTNHPPTLIASLTLTTVSLVGMAMQIVLKSDPFAFSVNIHTADHGQVEFHWESGFAHANLVGALDVNNNTIPLTPEKIPGQYRLRTGSGGPFFDYLTNRFGSQVLINGPNVCINGMFACSNSAAGYSCQWVTCGGVP